MELFLDNRVISVTTTDKLNTSGITKTPTLMHRPTAYMRFLNENRTQIIADVGGKSTLIGREKVTKVAKKGGELWRQMSDEDKKPFVDAAEKDKAAYKMAGQERRTKALIAKQEADQRTKALIAKQGQQRNRHAAAEEAEQARIKASWKAAAEEGDRLRKARIAAEEAAAACGLMYV